MKEFVITNGNVYINHNFKKVNLVIKDGIIENILSVSDVPERLPVYDAQDQYVIPGFIDVHTHGAVNVDVNSATPEGYEKISTFFASQGTTSWLCSVVTDTKEKTLWCIDQFNEYQKHNRNGAELIGIHLEGPFLSYEYRGSMSGNLLKPFDLELLKEYQDAANGGIKYITVSPEVSGVPENIKQMVDMGIVVSLGHSGADYETTKRCIELGATSATHTLNAMKLIHQHYPAISGAVLESDIYCEIIPDGLHLHPAIVRLLLKTKGLDRIVTITDSIMATGLPDGQYKLGVNDIIVKDGDAKLLNQKVRAGSTLTTNRALKNLVAFTGKSLEEVIPTLTENPAKMLGIFDKKGSIDVNKQADIVILNHNLDVIDTLIKGEKVNFSNRLQ